MIAIRWFYLFSNLLRVNAEFHEDKVVVKIKSLTFERQDEFSYEQVGEIVCQTHTDGGQLYFFGVLLLALGSAFSFTFYLIYRSFILFQVLRLLYVICLGLFLASFIRHRYYYLTDKYKKLLLGMKVTRSNREAISQVLERVRTKSKDLQELAFDQPFPNSKALFELTQHDLPGYLSRRQTRFYEDRFIELDKSILGTAVSTYEYTGLRPKLYRGRQGNTSWSTLFWLILSTWVVFAGFDRSFFFFSRPVLLFIMVILLAPAIVSLLLRYVKREIIAFYNRKDKVVYFIWVNRSNREKVEEIVKFVQSRISPVEDHEVLKEQP